MRVDPVPELILCGLAAEYMSDGRLGVPMITPDVPDHARSHADDPHAASRKDQH